MVNGLYAQVTGAHSVPPIYLVDRQGGTLYVTDTPNDSAHEIGKVRVGQWYTRESSRAILASDVPLTAQVRYRQNPVTSIAIPDWESGWVVTVGGAFRDVAIGQSLVVYAGDVVIGGGIITEVVHS